MNGYRKWSPIAGVACLFPPDGPRVSAILATLALGLALLLFPVGGLPASQNCRDCHAAMTRGFSPGHAFGSVDCTPCHGHRPAGTPQDAPVHTGIVAFPGLLENAQRTCGRCHAPQVDAVTRGIMHTGRGLVTTTRTVLGESHPGQPRDLSRLGDSPADSLLRKLCASCHLGQPKNQHRLDPTNDRGGGCLACHINAYPANGHPALSMQVADGRCFGCHSRSGRISLNYAGLAEASSAALAGDSPLLGRLGDQRLVESRPADSHHAAGMGCMDCHTQRDVMGADTTTNHLGQPVDIGCTDCHANRHPRAALGAWRALFPAAARRIPFPASTDTLFLTTARRNTPLWHVATGPDGARLYTKRDATMLRVPTYSKRDHPLASEHARLACSACHSQWAPQCYGCHLSYDAAGRQWDHLRHAVTPGRWAERRALIRNAPPPLGVTADDRIVPVVPGMIMTVEHPDWPRPRFVRRFARLEPHTTGPARACDTCHRAATALGLGAGTLRKSGGSWSFEPRHALLADGLPADAWTSLERIPPTAASGDPRPFRRAEIERILDAGSGTTPAR